MNNEVGIESCCNSEFIIYEDLAENNRVYLPQAFTPNMDTFNDWYKIIGTNIKDGHLKIRKGNKTLYEKPFYKQDGIVSGYWEGIDIKNKPCSDGKYEVEVNCTFTNGKNITLNSQFCLVTKCSSALQNCILGNQISYLGFTVVKSSDPLSNCN